MSSPMVASQPSSASSSSPKSDAAALQEQQQEKPKHSSWRDRFTWQKMMIPTLILTLVVTGTLNTIAGKIRSAPLGDASGYVTSIISQFVYFTTYWCILLLLWLISDLTHKDLMTMEEFLWVWTPRRDVDESKKGFWRWWDRLPGFKYTFFSSIADVLGDNLMFLTQPFLSIILFNLLQQGMVPFTLMWSCLLLAARYTFEELFGVGLVVAMTIASAVLSSASGGSSGVGMSILCLLSTLFQALGQVIREVMFRDYTQYAEKHGYKNKNLNVFAVSSSNHTFGIIWVFPISILVELSRTTDDVLGVMGEGFQTLLHAHGAMPAFVVFMVINVCFNITIYLMVCYGSSLLTFVSLKLTVPLSAFMSLISWPLIGADTITWFEWVCLVVILAGVIIFRHGNGVREKLETENEHLDETHNKTVSKAIICCWPIFRHRKPASPNDDPNRGVALNTSYCWPHHNRHQSYSSSSDITSLPDDIENGPAVVEGIEVPVK
ncbi:hypothetical protein FOL47_003983 [Perkinsus chesapeaki]|uniref:Uncharacterized protein n=1 Tax=Perkinsus chesapeaki TaxID=330153 RepID=A0A7J6MZU0_PERCH|nr:hypothetical protein FOL47_003983 [Perkinsus chesapeaki]